MGRIYLFILFIICCSGLVANGDPTDRLSALNRSANPTPRDIKDIHIIREDLHIRPGKYTTVSVKYVLWNASGKDYSDIDYGFPVDYQGAGEEHANSLLIGDYYSDSRSIFGWHDDYIKDIHFSANGKSLSYEVSPEIVLKIPPPSKEQLGSDYIAEFEDTFGEWTEEDEKLYRDMATLARKWFYTRFTIKAGEILTLDVRYTLRNAYSVASFVNKLIMEGYQSHSFLYYDLAPAVHWGNGKARDFFVEIDISDSDVTEWGSDSVPNSSGNNVSGLPFTRDGNKLIYKTRNFNFKDAEPIFLQYRPSDVPKTEEWLSRRISNDKYTIEVSNEIPDYPVSSLSDMDFETAWVSPAKTRAGGAFGDDTITIVFQEPVTLQALIILGGYHKNEETYFNNNRPKKMQVELYGMRKAYDEELGETSTFAGDIIQRENIWEVLEWKYETVNFNNLLRNCMLFEPSVSEEKVTKIKLYIQEIFPGRKYDETCISEIILLTADMRLK